MNYTYDTRDAELIAGWAATWNEREGARVGDFVILPSGEERRFTHDWDDGLQTTCGGELRGDQSFFFAKGDVSYSGALDPIVPRANLVATDETRDGRFWTFHHGEWGAHRGVNFTVPCRVFKAIPKEDERWATL